MTTTSTINCKSYYVCDKDNFNLFCAAALVGIIWHPTTVGCTPEKIVAYAADMAEAMMTEFQKRRMAP